MQRQIFYPKQFIDVTAMLTLQSACQNGSKDSLASIGAVGIVSGMVLAPTLPNSWSFTIAAGKCILEDGSIVTNATAKTVTIDPAVQSAPGSGITDYAIFLIPKLTQNTPIVTPDGATVNYIEFDDFNVVLIANDPGGDGTPVAAVAGGGYVGTRLGDLKRYVGQVSLGTTDFTTALTQRAVQLNNTTFFDLSKPVVLYPFALTVGSLQINGNTVGQDGFWNSIIAHAAVFSPGFSDLSGTVSLQMSSGTATLNGDLVVSGGSLAFAPSTEGPPAVALNSPGVGVGATYSFRAGSTQSAGQITINTGASGIYVGSDGALMLTFTMNRLSANGWLIFVQLVGPPGRGGASSPPIIPTGMRFTQGSASAHSVQLNWSDIGPNPNMTIVLNYFIVCLG